jgi:hypothetical protein
MKKLLVALILMFGVAMVSSEAQITAGRVLRPIRPDPNAPTPRVAAPAVSQTNAVPAVRTPLVSLLVVALDTNKDNIIDAAEISRAAEALKTLDLNKDGQLTGDEYLGKGESTNSPLIKVLDVNHDGVIDAREIVGAPSALRMLDKNFDGRLTLGEYKPVPAPVVPATVKTGN